MVLKLCVSLTQGLSRVFTVFNKNVKYSQGLKNMILYELEGFMYFVIYTSIYIDLDRSIINILNLLRS